MFQAMKFRKLRIFRYLIGEAKGSYNPSITSVALTPSTNVVTSGDRQLNQQEGANWILTLHLGF